MAWRIEIESAAEKELARLDRQAQIRILNCFRERVAGSDDPRSFGAPLRRSLAGLWKYRIGNYRVICHIEDQTITVLVLHVGHRSTVYSEH